MQRLTIRFTKKLDARILLHAASRDEPRAEHAVIAFTDLPVIGDDVMRVIGPVGHADDHHITGHRIEAGADGAAKPAWGLPLDQADARIRLHLCRDHIRRTV